MYFLELRGNDAKTEGGNTVSLRYHCGRQMGFCLGFTRVQLDLCKLHHTHHTTLTNAPDKKCLIQIDEISRGFFVARIINHSTMFPASPVVFGRVACPLRLSACQSGYGRY